MRISLDEDNGDGDRYEVTGELPRGDEDETTAFYSQTSVVTNSEPVQNSQNMGIFAYPPESAYSRN
jgi:hypothetical protein